MSTESVIVSGALPRVAAEEADWDAVFADQLPRIYNFFRYRVGDGAVAEDLTSITFEKAWRHRARYRRDRGAFTTWLLHDRAPSGDRPRAARRDHGSLDEAANLPAGETPEDVAVRRSDAERLLSLLATLPERERELIALKYGAELYAPRDRGRHRAERVERRHDPVTHDCRPADALGRARGGRLTMDDKFLHAAREHPRPEFASALRRRLAAGDAARRSAPSPGAASCAASSPSSCPPRRRSSRSPSSPRCAPARRRSSRCSACAPSPP